MYIHFVHALHVERVETSAQPEGSWPQLRGRSRRFAGVTYTFEDDRLSYPEQRYVTLGLLAGVPVSIVHTETADEIRILSFRKATRREITIYFESI